MSEIALGSAGFTELRNTGTSAVDIGGWSVRACDARHSDELAALPAHSILPAGGFYLIVGIDFAGTAERQLTVDSIAGTGVMLLNTHGTRIDSVGFSPESPCGEGASATMCAGASLGRDADVRDTDYNARDFVCQIPTPDESNA